MLRIPSGEIEPRFPRDLSHGQPQPLETSLDLRQGQPPASLGVKPASPTTKTPAWGYWKVAAAVAVVFVSVVFTSAHRRIQYVAVTGPVGNNSGVENCLRKTCNNAWWKTVAHRTLRTKKPTDN